MCIRDSYKHYSAISKASPLPIILYNVPSRTGVNMLAKTTIEIASNHSNIIGIKEACGDLNQVKQLIEKRPKDFMIISGPIPFGSPRDTTNLIKFCIWNDYCQK